MTLDKQNGTKCHGENYYVSNIIRLNAICLHAVATNVIRRLVISINAGVAKVMGCQIIELYMKLFLCNWVFLLTELLLADRQTV
jgi:hypothetical protein